MAKRWLFVITEKADTSHVLVLGMALRAAVRGGG